MVGLSGSLILLIANLERASVAVISNFIFLCFLNEAYDLQPCPYFSNFYGYANFLGDKSIMDALGLPIFADIISIFWVLDIDFRVAVVGLC